MAVDLLKIPGVEPKRNRPLQRALRSRRSRRRMLTPRKPIDWTPILLGVFCTGLVLYVLHALWAATRVEVATENLTDGMTLTSTDLSGRAIRLDIDPPDRAHRLALYLDGQEVASKHYSLDGGLLTWRLGRLPEGQHEVSLTVPRPVLAESRFRWRFRVDDRAPGIEVPRLLGPVGVCQPVTIEGRVEPGATLARDGQPVTLGPGGTFTFHYDRPPPAPLHLVATDEAGNQTHAEVIVPVRYPGGQGVHVTAAAWAYEPLRTPILALVDAGLVSVVQLDLKDEGGIVGYDSKVPLAHEIGAVRTEFRLRETVADLKRRGVRVIGRVVAFRDAPLADWAWRNGHRDWVVQTADGDRLGLYGGFTNVASADVLRYNLDLALEAVDAGVDDIMWDYIRRPEGDLASMAFPGLRGTPEEAVVDFLATTGAALRERCAYQGAAVFGISADRPFAVSQDIPRMARHLDYVAPMLYPSHWVKGEYGVRDPTNQPGDIVHAALADFQAKVAGTGTVLVPWLQDFTLGASYGPAEVRAQIDAAGELGVHDWMLWNAGVRYTREALDRSLVQLRAG